jgi:hypothetical protein
VCLLIHCLIAKSSIETMNTAAWFKHTNRLSAFAIQRSGVRPAISGFASHLSNLNINNESQLQRGSSQRWFSSDSSKVEVTKTSPSTKKAKAPPPPFKYTPLFEAAHPDTTTEYRQILPASAVETVTLPDGQTMLRVSGEALRTLSSTAFEDIAHLLRPAHLAQLRKILDDTEASNNDRFVAMELLKNANIASGRVLPGCQDTGTAVCDSFKCIYDSLLLQRPLTVNVTIFCR